MKINNWVEGYGAGDWGLTQRHLDNLAWKIVLNKGGYSRKRIDGIYAEEKQVTRFTSLVEIVKKQDLRTYGLYSGSASRIQKCCGKERAGIYTDDGKAAYIINRQ